MKRRILAIALAAGALAGAAGAAVNAQEPAPMPSPVAVPAATPAPIPVSPPSRRGKLADGRYNPSWSQYRIRDERIAVRLDDPAGGPAWAVKEYDAQRLMLKRPSRTLDDARSYGRQRCVQLGRLQGDDFGWVYGDGRFRKMRIEDSTLLCTPRKRALQMGRLVSVLRIGDPAAPKITGSVVWGMLPGAGSVTVAGTGGLDGPAASDDGVFLKLAGPGAKAGPGARVQGGGKTIRLGPGQIPQRALGRFRFPTIIGGSERIEAPAPDPSGGPRYGILVAQTREGQPCAAGPSQVVDGRPGPVDLRLGLLWDRVLTGRDCRPLQTQPDAERPCDIGTGFGNAEELEGDDRFLERARTERRLLAGRTTLWAQCSADVQRVTIRTPRDIRTLVPSPVGHVVLAVYDGGFVGGGVELTAHLRGGKTWTQAFPLGMFF